MNRRQLLLGVGLLILLGLAGVLVACLAKSEERVSPATFRRIEQGMTEAQVEQIMGRLADDEEVGLGQLRRGVHYEETPGSWALSRNGAFRVKPVGKMWMSADRQGLIWVDFISGRVAGAAYSTASPARKSFLDRLRRRLPW